MASGSAAHSQMSPTIYPYPLSQAFIANHRSPNLRENVLEEVMRESINGSPHLAHTAEAADFFFVPVPFHWGGQGRDAVARALLHVRMAWPYFNQSLRSKQPNHLLIFTGDLGVDTPPKRVFSNPLPPEVDTASRQRHFVALTLTGSPETGFQPGKDVVLPPTRDLKGGPMRGCCDETAIRGQRRSQRKCKPSPHALADSPWRRRADNRSAVGAARPRAQPLLFWAGQATGGGMGRHGGSGPITRRWLGRTVASLGDEMQVTDTSNREHLERNVRLLPPSDLYATAPSERRYGMIHPHASLTARFCACPYGRGNGWEGRSAHAVRHGCVPARLHPEHAQMPLEPFVPWARFSLLWRVDQSLLRTDPHGQAKALHAALSSVSPARLDRMRCEMACAAVHMTWEATPARNPPASCAGAAVGESGRKTGVLATLMALLGNRNLPAARRRVARPCPCEGSSDDWHFFDADLLREENRRAQAARKAWLSIAAGSG